MECETGGEGAHAHRHPGASPRARLAHLVAGIWIATQVVPPLAMTSRSVFRQRRVPIYKVERSDRKLSISFDATWGADQTG